MQRGGELFYGALVARVATASNGRIRDEWRIGRDWEGSGRVLIREHPEIFSEGVSKKAKNLRTYIPSTTRTEHLPNTLGQSVR
jgi:hypothetical protein